MVPEVADGLNRCSWLLAFQPATFLSSTDKQERNHSQSCELKYEMMMANDLTSFVAGSLGKKSSIEAAGMLIG